MPCRILGKSPVNPAAWRTQSTLLTTLQEKGIIRQQVEPEPTHFISSCITIYISADMHSSYCNIPPIPNWRAR